MDIKNNSESIKLRLRGKGSGYKEGSEQKGTSSFLNNCKNHGNACIFASAQSMRTFLTLFVWRSKGWLTPYTKNTGYFVTKTCCRFKIFPFISKIINLSFLKLRRARIFSSMTNLRFYKTIKFRYLLRIETRPGGSLIFMRQTKLGIIWRRKESFS